MRVRVMLDVWLNVYADSEAEARARTAQYSHLAELDIDDLHAIGEILEVEEDEPGEYKS